MIDTHAHVFTAAYPMAPGRRYTPEYDATCEDFLAQLDENGVTSAVLVQPSFYGTDNRCMVDALRHAKGRLRGIAVIDPAMPPEILNTLGTAGCVGIRLNLIGAKLPDFGDPEWKHCLARLAALDWLIEIQATDADWPILLPPLAASGLAVVIDHFGLPNSTDDTPGLDAILRGAEGGRVWVKLSAPYRADAHAVRHRAALLLRELGPARLLWGSDWPWTQHESGRSYAGALESLAVMVPDDDARQQILHKTPAALFGFSQAST